MILRCKKQYESGQFAQILQPTSSLSIKSSTKPYSYGRHLEGDLIQNLLPNLITDVVLDSFEAPKQQHDIERPLDTIVNAAEKYLVKGDEHVKWTTEEIVFGMKRTHDRVVQLEKEKEKHYAQDQESSPVLMKHMEMRREAERKASVLYSSPLPPRRTSIQTTQPVLILRPTAEESIQQPSESEHEANMLQERINELTEKVKNLDIKNSQKAEECFELQYQLNYNWEFGTQISNDKAANHFLFLRKRLEEISDSSLAKFPLPRHHIINLADNFDEVPLKPLQSSPLEYLLLLFMHISHAPKTDDATFRSQIEHSIIWLSTKLTDILKLSSTQANNLLLVYLEQIIKHHLPFQKGIAHSALYMIVAKLAGRSNDVRDTGLWQSLHEATVNHQLGDLVEDWDFIDELSFYYFLAMGPVDSTASKSFVRHKEIAKEIRSSHYLTNFLGLFHLPSIKAHMSKDDSTNMYEISDGDDKLAILFTRPQPKSARTREYIWTVEHGIITLSRGGFTFKIEPVPASDDLLIFVRAICGSAKKWFLVDQKDTTVLEYLCTYHREEFKDAGEELGLALMGAIIQCLKIQRLNVQP